MESGAELSQKLSQFHGITAYPWATEKLLSDYRKPLCKKEISQKSAFINKEMAAPLNNPALSVFAVAECRNHAIFGHFHFRGVPGSSLLWRYLWRFVAWDHSAGELSSWRAPQHRFVLAESRGISAARSGISVILSKDSVNARVSVQTATRRGCWPPRPTPRSPSVLRAC